MPISKSGFVGAGLAQAAAAPEENADAFRRDADPLIGSETFNDTVLLTCAAAAKRAPTRTEMLRCQRVARGLGQMLADPFAVHTVGSLAKAAGMSRSSFAQCFTEIFARSPLDYLKTERLRHAAHLIRTTSLPLKMVANRIGYRSVSYFSRAFRAQFNLAPGRGRALAQGWGAETLPGASSALGSRVAGRDDQVNDRFQLICDATHDVMWDIDLTTGQVWWSEGMLPVFGYGPDQIGPDTTWCHEHIHPDDRQRVVDGMTKACAGGDRLWRDQFRYRKADGNYAYVSDRGLIMRDPAGRAVRFVGAMTDISVYMPADALAG